MIGDGTNFDTNEAGESLISTRNTFTDMKKTSLDDNTVKEGYSLVTSFLPGQFSNDGESVGAEGNDIENHLPEEGEQCLEIGVYEGQGDNIVLQTCLTFEAPDLPGEGCDGLCDNAKGGIILVSVLVTCFVAAWVYLTYFHKKRDAVADDAVDNKEPDDDDDDDDDEEP